MKLLILDIDETLVYAAKNKLLETEADFLVPHPFGDYYYYKRPHLDFFIEKVKVLFKLALWSSADKYYVNEVKQQLFANTPLEFAWDRTKCTYTKKGGEGIYEKQLHKLEKLNWDLANIFIIDDSPEKLSNYPQNHLLIPSWIGDKNDQELIKIIEVLKILA
jgi:carboxy-terminal domain RNA polymerase II polypeptide A small phosphatase